MNSTALKTFLSQIWKTVSRKGSGCDDQCGSCQTLLPATDWVGYEVLIDYMEKNRIGNLPGDLVEIGTFLGGGAAKLSRHLRTHGCSKKLFVIDIFDPSFDQTVNLGGDSMSEIYRNALDKLGKRTQKEVFQAVTKGCNNIVLLECDSKRVQIPSEQLCFGFIDGNHDPEYVENDFYLVWRKLTPGGAVAFHDYEWDLPQTTQRIKDLVARHEHEIAQTDHNSQKHILFVRKA